jgi:hypothetical protein
MKEYRITFAVLLILGDVEKYNTIHIIFILILNMFIGIIFSVYLFKSSNYDIGRAFQSSAAVRKEFSVSCPKGSYVNEISGRGAYSSLRAFYMSCSDGSVLFSFDAGENPPSGNLVKNTYADGYSALTIATSFNGVIGILPEYYMGPSSSAAQQAIGTMSTRGSNSKRTLCSAGTTDKITGLSGHVDIGDVLPVVKDLQVYCECKHIYIYIYIYIN